MRTDIIILAQGMQTRLPQLAIPKHMVSLPGCANAPLITRTIVQLHALLEGLAPMNLDHACTIVAAPELRRMILAGMGIRVPVPPASLAAHPELTGRPWYYTPRFHELSDPGNSSLKGADRALRELRRDWAGNLLLPPDRTVILLGDAIYSWKCLSLLLERTQRDITVCGTHDLSPSGGELWGISWDKSCDGWVRGALTAALEKHPPFKDYQCGQLRRWFWEMTSRNAAAATFGATAPLVWYAVDDYTNDIDTGEDLAKIGETSRAAAADDAEHGVTWP